GALRIDLTSARSSVGNEFILTPDRLAPANPLDFAVDTLDCLAASATLGWTAPGDDGMQGTAASYDLRWSFDVITEANFSSAAPIPTASPSPAGSHETQVVGISYGARRYFALEAVDNVGNHSPLGKVLHVDGPRNIESCLSAPVSIVRGDEPAIEIPRSTSGQGSMEVRFVIPAREAGQPFTLGLYDVSGRRIALLAQGAAAPGATTISLAGRVPRMSKGVYFVRLTVGARAR